MDRPTKEEAREWQQYLTEVAQGRATLSVDDAVALDLWLQRVHASLPSAAALQRGRERRRRVRLVKTGDNDEGPLAPRHLPSQGE